MDPIGGLLVRNPHVFRSLIWYRLAHIPSFADRGVVLQPALDQICDVTMAVRTQVTIVPKVNALWRSRFLLGKVDVTCACLLHIATQRREWLKAAYWNIEK